MARLDDAPVNMRLILASASPSRRRVLEDAGVRPVVQVSNVDEEALAASLGDLPVADLALHLARAKARDVAQRFVQDDDVVVVGCDSIFELDGTPYGKPLTATVAKERIRLMSGRTGTLHTGHWVCFGEHQAGRTTSTRIDFAPMSDEEIDAYVASGEPLNVAGSFTLDGRSAAFITSIAGDPGNVIGISLPTLREILAPMGVDWTTLWAGT